MFAGGIVDSGPGRATLFKGTLKRTNDHMGASKKSENAGAFLELQEW